MKINLEDKRISSVFWIGCCSFDITVDRSVGNPDHGPIEAGNISVRIWLEANWDLWSDNFADFVLRGQMLNVGKGTQNCEQRGLEIADLLQ